ncbi:MAG TPA: YceI family protein [Thermoanaerobaculia bacterium]
MAAVPLPAAEPVSASATHLTVAAGSRLWLEGDSTLHKYSSTASQVEVAAEIGGATTGTPADLRGTIAGGGLTALRIEVPVASLKSGESGLDKNLQKALKAETAPVIRFRLTGYTATDAKDGALRIEARGRLSIAGVEKDDAVEATCRFTASGVEVTGMKELKMSDFGVKPPTLFLGTVKTADKVVVRFSLNLKT